MALFKVCVFLLVAVACSCDAFKVKAFGGQKTLTVLPPRIFYLTQATYIPVPVADTPVSAPYSPVSAPYMPVMPPSMPYTPPMAPSYGLPSSMPYMPPMAPSYSQPPSMPSPY